MIIKNKLRTYDFSAAVTAQAFTKNYWGSKYGVFGASEFGLDFNFNWDALNRILGQRDIKINENVLLFREGARLLLQAKASAGYRGVLSGSLLDEQVRSAFVNETIASRGTVVLLDARKYFSEFNEFHYKVSNKLGVRLSMNIYATPSSSQGLAFHRDEYDVFVVQLEGEKHWTLAGGLAGSKTKKRENLTLKKGQVLYIPKGLGHKAVTKNHQSLHLTIGLQPLTVGEFIHNLVEYRSSETFNAFSGKRVSNAVTKELFREDILTPSEAKSLAAEIERQVLRVLNSDFEPTFKKIQFGLNSKLNLFPFNSEILPDSKLKCVSSLKRSEIIAIIPDISAKELSVLNLLGKKQFFAGELLQRINCSWGRCQNLLSPLIQVGLIVVEPSHAPKIFKEGKYCYTDTRGVMVLVDLVGGGKMTFLEKKFGSQLKSIISGTGARRSNDKFTQLMNEEWLR